MMAELPPPAAAFARTVETMVARQAKLPSMLVYDANVHVHSEGDRDYLLHYEVEVASGRFTLTVPSGPRPLVANAPYPLEPDFNALTDFYTDGEWRSGGRDNGRFANDVRPLAAEAVGAGAAAIRGYLVRYGPAARAGDPLLHLLLVADPELERRRTVLREVDVDPASWLPVRVVLHTPFGRSTVTLDYTPIAGIPFVTRYDIRKTVRVFFASARFETEAIFTNIVFDRPYRERTVDGPPRR